MTNLCVTSPSPFHDLAYLFWKKCCYFIRSMGSTVLYIWVALLCVLFRHGNSVGYTDLVPEKNSTCLKLQTKFASAAKDFVYCSVTNARPITFCEACVTSYLNVSAAHQEILTGKENEIDCQKQLVNVDRLQIIETLYSNVDSLWTRGECNNCFEVNVNGSTTSKLNNVTINFQKLNSIVRKCVKDNEPKDKPDICVICRDSYEKLNEFYNKLKNSETPSHICMDIVDSMNASRREWSQDLGCRDNPGADLPYIMTASCMTLVPLVFYVSLWTFSTRIRPSS